MQLKNKIITLIMAVLIVISSVPGAFAFNADCIDHACCCHRAAMTGPGADTTMLRSVKGCCCQRAVGRTCNLGPTQATHHAGWALVSRTAHAPSMTIFVSLAIPDAFLGMDRHFPLDIERPVVKGVSRPIYQTVMAFLC